jgi:hypothetical protein
LCVSSRGAGDVDKFSGLVSDFSLKAVDIVHDPSAPDAFVDALMEQRQWLMESGVFTPELIEAAQKYIK